MASKVLRGDTGGGGGAPTLYTDVQTADQTLAVANTWEDSEMSITLDVAVGDILSITASGNIYSANTQPMNPSIKILLDGTNIREAFINPSNAATTCRFSPVLTVNHPVTVAGTITIKVQFKFSSGTAPTFTGGNSDQDQRWRLQILQFSA